MGGILRRIPSRSAGGAFVSSIGGVTFKHVNALMIPAGESKNVFQLICRFYFKGVWV